MTFAITAERTWPETKTVAKKEHSFSLPLAEEDCPTGIWISDIIAPPDTSGEKPTLVVLFLAGTWSSAVDGAQYHATFIEMPDGE